MGSEMKKVISSVPLTYTDEGSGCINTPHGGTKPPYKVRHEHMNACVVLRQVSLPSSLCKSIAKADNNFAMPKFR